MQTIIHGSVKFSEKTASGTAFAYILVSECANV